MKKLLRVSIASLLAVILATTTVLAQESGKWVTSQDFLTLRKENPGMDLFFKQVRIKKDAGRPNKAGESYFALSHTSDQVSLIYFEDSGCTIMKDTNSAEITSSDGYWVITLATEVNRIQIFNIARTDIEIKIKLSGEQAEIDKITGGNPNIIVDFYSVEPPAKVDFTTPEAADYTLVDKKTENPYKAPGLTMSLSINTYAEDVLKAYGNIKYEAAAVNLDYFYTFNRSGNIVGDWIYLTQEGYVAKQERGVASVELPGGYKLVLNEGLYPKAETLAGFELPFRHFTGGLLYLPDQAEPLKYVTFKSLSNDALWKAATQAGITAGYLSGDRLYQVSEAGEVYIAAQIVNGIPYPAMAEDKVVDAQLGTDERGRTVLDVKYENGDFVKIYDGYVVAAQLRKNSVTAKEVNGKIITTFQLASGDKYVGSFKNSNGEVKNFLWYRTLFVPNNRLYYDGTLIRKDETMMKYINGYSEEEIAAAKKLQAQQNNAIYKQLCDKYGKKYVDSALIGEVIVGMPEDLLLDRFSCNLNQQSGSFKCYLIKGPRQNDYLGLLNPNATRRAYVWVRSGRVTSVTNY